MSARLRVLALLAVTAFYANAGEPQMSKEEWLQSTYAKVAAYDVSKIPVTKLEGPYPSPKGGHDYFFFPKRNGMIRFKDGSWICITSHSAHADDGIGDITLIKTSEGEYFVNRGHCCPKLGIRSTAEMIGTLDSFLATKGDGPNATLLAWMPYKIEAGADQPATKPADKVPAKDKPSTPTSKDGSR